MFATSERMAVPSVDDDCSSEIDTLSVYFVFVYLMVELSFRVFFCNDILNGFGKLTKLTSMSALQIPY
jgi:hypothetical protein